MTEEAYINNLPVEIFDIILRLINGCDLGRCRRVCKDWKEVIDSSEHLWLYKCRQEFKNSSLIAKRKSGNQCTWYHIYKNLTQWSDVKKFVPEVRQFYKFFRKDKAHALDIDYGLLPLKADRSTLVFDTSVLENITVLPTYTLPDRTCIKVANNDTVSIIQVNMGIYVQRTVNEKSPNFVTEGFFKADSFILSHNHSFFHYERNVFKLDLKSQELSAKFLVTIKYNIKEMQYSGHILYIFTDYGFTVELDMNKDTFNDVKYTLINCPVEWTKHIKHISAVDGKNFVCYSRNLLKIEAGQCKHLYLEFPPITALFFYVDTILLGTMDGRILIYRLSSQKAGSHKPIFHLLARLPNGEVPLQLDVCERKTGPIIIASTILRMYIIEFLFFPHEKRNIQLTSKRIDMHARMERISNRMTITSNYRGEKKQSTTTNLSLKA